MDEPKQINARNVFLSEGKLVIAIFVGGVAVILWIVNAFLSPLTILKEDVVNLRDNHIHTIEGNIVDMQASLIEQGKALIRVQTILEERLPAKK